jgi:hypothetical protein
MADEQNPYDALIQQDTAQRVRVNMMDATAKAPDVEARLQSLAKQYQMPVDAVRLRLPEIEQRAKFDAVDYDSLAQRYPKTASHLSNPQAAVLAQDDTENLSTLERIGGGIKATAQYLFSAPQAKNTLMGDIGAGLYGASRGAAGVFQAGAEALAVPFDFLEPFTGMGGNPLRRLAEGFGTLGAQADAGAKALSPAQSGVVAGGVSSGVQSLTQNLLSLPMAFLPGGQAAALTMMAGGAGGQSYQTAREKGVGQWQALGYGASDAVVEYATEKLPLGKLLGDVKEGTPLLKSVLHNAALEVPGEQAATVLQDLNEWATLNPDKPFSDYLAERPGAAAQTLIATVIGSGGVVSLTHAMQKAADNATGTQRSAQQAEAHAQVLGQLATLAEASKVRERDPAQFRQFMQSVVEEGVPNVYVDANALLQAHDINEIAMAIPAVAEQIAEAHATGGDLVIPTAELLTAGPGHTFMQTLLDNARTSPEAMSAVEARTYMQEHGDQLRADIEQVLAEKDGDQTWQAQRDAVRDQFKTQLDQAKRFTSDVNQQYAGLLANFYSVTAARLGIAPQELVDRYGLQVRADGVAGGRALDQADRGPFGPVFTQFKGDAQGAIARLREQQGGEAVGALHHPELGNIDLVWGDEGTNQHDGYGLAKLVRRHPEVLDSLQEIVASMPVVKRSANRAMLESADHKGGVRLQWDGVRKHWLLTAFRKDTGRGGGAPRTDTSTEKPADGSLPDHPSDASVDQALKTFYQQARGSINLPEDLTSAPAVISLFKGADLSTFVHESGHFFLEVQMDLAARIQAQIADGASVTDGEREIVDDANKLLDWFGVKGAEGVSPLTEWHGLDLEAKRPMHEQFARGFEAYAFEGNSPSVELTGMFSKFRAWMLAVYKELKALRVDLTDDVRGVMDRMLASTQAIQEAEAARRMGPLFKTAEQAGMSLDEFKAYHALATGATQTAIEELQSLGLRDMRWLSGAKDRKLKELQAQYKTLRSGVQTEVRAEVMAQPVYRAWQFLTGKGDAIDTAQPDKPEKTDPKVLDVVNDSMFKAIAKLGGLDKDEAIGLWGVDPKEKIESGVFGTPVLRKSGGLSVDAMAARLTEVGYLLPDENGAHDVRAFKEAFDAERRGDPIYSTWHEYQRPDEAKPEALPDHVAFGKLDTDALVEQYGNKEDAPWRKLQGLRMTSQQRGIHPDVVAETFGFDSGDALVKALLDAEPPKSVIEGMTDQRMLERFGDLGTVEGLGRAADRAIHNEARARFVATEIRALETGMRARAPTGRVNAQGRPVSVDLLAVEARRQADAIIARQRVRDLKPGQYTAAEARAAKAAEKAMASGDLAAALAEKRHQVINIQAARAALAAQEEIQRAVKKLAKLGDRPKGIDAEYLDQIDALLDRFDLRQGVSLKAIDKRKTLVEWVEAQREQGMVPDIAPELLNEATRKSFKDMTVEEVRGLRDAVLQIAHLGKLKNQLLTSKAMRDFAAVRDEIADSITLHAGDRVADTRTPAPGTLGARLKTVKDFGAAHIKAATWARVFDGGKDGGPVWEYLIRTANDSANMETTMRAEATEKLHGILAPVLAGGKMHGKGTFFPSIGRSMNREQVFAMALNMGNEGNLQRMLDGEGWTLAQIKPVLDTLGLSDWQAAQQVWDHFESYRPQIAAKERRIYGKEPAWVEPMPFDVTVGGQTLSLRGGYFPVKYDPLANNRAEQHSDAESAERQLRGAYTSATTRRGFTKARAEAVTGRPLLYSLSGVYSGVQDVIHDLAFHEWLIDANKILRSDKIDAAIREHYGPQATRQFKTWVAAVAAGEQGLQAELDGALGRIRHGVSMAGLGFNVMSALMQPLGLTQSIVRVGAKWVGKGLGQYIASPVSKTREVNGKSEFMAGRARTRFRELNELRNQVEGEHPLRTAMGGSAYFLMMRCQQLVDTPTWLGAYEKAVSEGNDEERSIALADQAVIDAQGGGQTKDLAAVERGGPGHKLFTVFYSFMNTALNAGVAKAMTVADTPKAKAKLAADMLMLYTVPAVLGAVLKDALTPGDSGDWDEWDKAVKKLLGEQLSYLMGLFVLVRETTEAAKIAASLSDRPMGYGGPAGLRPFVDLTAFAKQANQGEFDDAFRKASVNLLGDLFALPAAQVNKSITGAQALAEGQTENPAALVLGYQKP